MMANTTIGVILILIVVVCLVLAALGIFALLIRAAFQIVAGVLNAIFGSSRRPIPPRRFDPHQRRIAQARGVAAPSVDAKVCRNNTCGHYNHHQARYCARCGMKM